MPHATDLIAVIALGLVLAFAFGIIAHRLRLPPLVGYLLAGVALGPDASGLTGGTELVHQLAELGVILLMFGVGLHFSLKDLIAVRAIALPGALVQIAVATLMGGALATAWGWSGSASFVFGLSLSVASTVVLLRALSERGLIDTDKGRIAVGWLIVEDLAMIVAVVLLPIAALSLDGDGIATQGNGWLPLAWTLAKAIGFAGLMLVLGRRLVPWLLEQAARTGSRELFTLAVLALALGIAFGSATLFGVSFALGAFFAGMVLAESDLSHQAAADSLPLQDAFAVLFFVSVGMLFDPTILLRQPLAVLAVLSVIMVGKALAAVAIVLSFRHPIATALTIAASLAQIGEFSFILAGLGVSLGLLPEEGRDLVLAGALLSIMLNPFVFALAQRATRILTDRPELARRLDARHTARLPLANPGAPRSDHAVIVGYGRVGSGIATAMRAYGFPFVVVDRDRRRILEMRAKGIDAVFGNATARGVLHAAGIDPRRRHRAGTPPGGRDARRASGAPAPDPRARGEPAHRHGLPHPQRCRAPLPRGARRRPRAHGRARARVRDDVVRAPQPGPRGGRGAAVRRGQPRGAAGRASPARAGPRRGARAPPPSRPVPRGLTAVSRPPARSGSHRLDAPA
jgi:monovalent cation:H+ antiporter-2, CPA2 family